MSKPDKIELDSRRMLEDMKKGIIKTAFELIMNHNMHLVTTSKQEEAEIVDKVDYLLGLLKVM